MTAEAAQCVDEIERQMEILADAGRITPEFLAAIEDGEQWVEKMRQLIDDYE